MGFDFGEFFSDAWSHVEDSLNDTLSVAVPGVKASLEQWGIDVLTKQNQETRQELNQAVYNITKNDSPPGSFGAALTTTLQGTIFQTYGGYILVGVIGLIILGMYLRK